MRNAIHEFNEKGLKSLTPGSSRPKEVHAAFDEEGAEALRELLLHQLRATEPAFVGRSRRADAPPPEGGKEGRHRPEGPLSCYGLYVPELERTWLRFVDGRPMSATTTQFLEWSCQRHEAMGKKALLLVWDNASWHKSKFVKDWIAAHNRRIKDSGLGVRIVPCLLPKKSPWLNPIEPKWIHGKRKVVEPDGDPLGAYELADRVCRVFGCPHYEHLSIHQEVA